MGSTGGNNPNALKSNVPTGVNASTSLFEFDLLTPNVFIYTGPTIQNNLTQWNILDTLTWQLRRHTLTTGVNYLTRTSTLVDGSNEYIVYTATDSKPPYTTLQNGTVGYLNFISYTASPVVSIKNTSLYINDSWRMSRSLTVNLGLRWEYNPAPSIGPLGTLVPQGSLLDLSTLTASVSNQPLYANRYDNFAPRFGFAWSPLNSKGSSTVVRGGAGIYFDTGQASTATQAGVGNYPYYNEQLYSNLAYDSINWSGLTANQSPLPVNQIFFVDSNLLSPRTYEWSLALEQEFGKHINLSVSYVGNDGEKLVGRNEYYNKANSQGVYPINTSLVTKNGALFIIANQSHSNYQALQTQVTGRVTNTVSALASYTWGHAEDNGSTDFSSVGALAPNPIANSAYDIRQMFSAAIHYAPNGLGSNKIVRAVTSGWGIDTIARLQTASPLTVTVNQTNPEAFLANADVMSSQPAVLHEHYDSFGKVVPGNKLLNWSAFTAPPTDATGNPLRQGNSPTNGYRLFGLTQWDVAVGRSWKVWERVNMAFRVDAFNLPNTANFVAGSSWTPSDASTFGRAVNTYAGSYGSQPSGLGQTGAQLSVFQNGGPRQLQLSLKLKF